LTRRCRRGEDDRGEWQVRSKTLKEKLKDSMNGKICLVTGGTNGIGKATAQALARMGATVVIAGRNAPKTAQLVEEIRTATGNKKVDFLLADLSSQQEVLRLANEFKSRYSHLHVLLNNAGGFFLRRQLSADGIEMTFALNHLAYFLLTNLLLDTIKASAPARIINVSSDAHASGKIEFDNLQGERGFSPRAYDNSKLANILFTIELARRLEGTGVTVNALHPGFVATGFAKNNGKVIAALISIFAPLVARSPAKGAETSIYLASSPEMESITGKYFVDCRVTQPVPQATDSAVAKKLWDVSAEMVHLAVRLPAKT
ncbi:MAG TPA: SDR family oxidoreductase, partial [Anaerolineales bacterium]|nr:SDR family oxidoreductase [Anaerolineales bacterium]